jgi:hypothetical protein
MYGERKIAYRILVGKPEGRNLLKDTGVDGSIILKRIFRKWDVACTRFVWLITGSGGGLL